ncbi:DUF1659 domain-containing protein [Bacillus sp. DJP31]|uniref:DUF1659 domain-containing protein n=1 Tax=Bacillus sp. DJP31 TaxID=3409789 RepID=UPI003BB5290B
MAQAMIADTQLRIAFDMGVDVSGKAVVKNKNYSNIKTSATTDELFTVAQSIALLQQYPLSGIERNDTHILGE